MKKLKILGFFCLFRKEKKISSTFPPHPPPPRDFKFWRFYIELKLTFFFHVESDAESKRHWTFCNYRQNKRDAAEVWWQLFIIAAKLFQYNQRWLWIRWTYWRHYSKHTILYIEQRIRIIYVKKSLTKQIKQQSWKKYLL